MSTGFSGSGTNNGFGVNIMPSSTTPVPNILIENSTILYNGGTGFGGGINIAGGNVQVADTTAYANGQYNLGVGSAATAVLSGDTFLGTAPTDISNTGGSVISYGNNVLRNNGSPTSTVPLQ